VGVNEKPGAAPGFSHLCSRHPGLKARRPQALDAGIWPQKWARRVDGLLACWPAAAWWARRERALLRAGGQGREGPFKKLVSPAPMPNLG